VIVELQCRTLDADALDVFGNKIETLVGEIEKLRCLRHPRAKLRNQRLDVGGQPIFQGRIVSPVRGGPLAPVLCVLFDLCAPAQEAMEDIGRVDVALADEAELAEHQQEAVAREFIDARLRQRVLQRGRHVPAKRRTGCNQLFDLTPGQATFVKGPPASHRRAPQ